eukprot:NODE_169_length_14535_cov_0.769881.p1 type:complete len:794 gc:universal NODE_169_length_14535_cov_0.769881:5376-2995(-)
MKNSNFDMSDTDSVFTTTNTVKAPKPRNIGKYFDFLRNDKTEETVSELFNSDSDEDSKLEMIRPRKNSHKEEPRVTEIDYNSPKDDNEKVAIEFQPVRKENTKPRRVRKKLFDKKDSTLSDLILSSSEEEEEKEPSPPHKDISIVIKPVPLPRSSKRIQSNSPSRKSHRRKTGRLQDVKKPLPKEPKELQLQKQILEAENLNSYYLSCERPKLGSPTNYIPVDAYVDTLARKSKKRKASKAKQSIRKTYVNSESPKSQNSSVYQTTLGRRAIAEPLSWSEKCWYRIVSFFTHGSAKFLVLIIYFAICAALFWIYYATYTNRVAVYELFGPFLGIAKGAAAIINFNSSLLLISMSRKFLTMIRSSVLSNVMPFDHSIEFHKVLGIMTVLSAILHVIAHIYNYLFIYGNLNLSTLYLLTRSVPGITGLVLEVLFFLALTGGMSKVKQTHFEIFYYSHYLWLATYVVTIPHGMYCFVGKLLGEPETCAVGGTFIRYSIIGLLFFIAESIIIRNFGRRKPLKMTSVMKRGSNVLEMTFKIPKSYGGKNFVRKTKAGMYIFLNCKSISYFQYHPFTLSNAPSDGYFNINMRCKGDWSKKLAKECGVDFDTGCDVTIPNLPKLYFDGPFGSSSNDVFQFKISLLVGVGIGITPFASVIKELFIRKSENRSDVEKVYLFWICRDPDSFEWFTEILRQVQDCQEIETYIYLSGPKNLKDTQSISYDSNNSKMWKGLKYPTFDGKPHWNTIFTELTENHPSKDIGIFSCAPPDLCQEIKEICVSQTLKSQNRTVLHFHQENF